MKKKQIVLAMILIFIFLLALGGCNSIKINKNYHQYSFDVTKGTFVKSLSNINFGKKDYNIYDNNGQLVETGEHFREDFIITFVPDKIGDNNNRMLASTSRIVYKDYIIDPTLGLFSAERWTYGRYEDKKDLEGIYNASGQKILLKDGNIYESYDGSNTVESFTEKIGEYKLNKNKDFVEINMLDGVKMSLLHYTYKNALEQTVSALVDTFFTYKKPKFTVMQDSIVEMYTKFFENKSTAGGMSDYELELISFPNATKFHKGVTFELDGENSQASIRDNILTFQGTGSVDIIYKYKNITDSVNVQILKFDIKENLTPEDKTFNVGDDFTFSQLFNMFVDYDYTSNLTTSITLNSTTLAEVENRNEVPGGLVSFNGVGDVTLNFVGRYVTTLEDGTQKSLVITKSITLKIEE